MNFSDFLIIYLACGSSFAAYYFFQNRKDSNQRKLIFNTLFTLTVWFPYAFQLWHSFITKKLNSDYFGLKNSTHFQSSENLESFNKFFSDFLFSNNIQIGIYDFREVFERYAGLSLAVKNSEKSLINFTETELEFSRITDKNNPYLSAKCLHRKNLERLLHHQNFAAQDISRFFSEMMNAVSDKDLLVEKIKKFYLFVDDKKSLTEFSGLILSEAEIPADPSISAARENFAAANS